MKGTDEGESATWKNPSESGKVDIIAEESTNKHNLISRVGGQGSSKNQFIIDLKSR